MDTKRTETRVTRAQLDAAALLLTGGYCKAADLVCNFARACNALSRWSVAVGRAEDQDEIMSEAMPPPEDFAAWLTLSDELTTSLERAE